MVTDDNKKDGEIVLRNYQVELFEKIRHQNAILFLPTGSGKTCIALWLMKSLAKDVNKYVIISQGNPTRCPTQIQFSHSLFQSSLWIVVKARVDCTVK